MTIDTTGQWWVGSAADDVLEYLRAYEAQGYAVQEARLCRCGCGSVAFAFEADRTEGVAQRICAKCGTDHWICDSNEYLEDAELEHWQCTECGCKTCNLGVGFSLYEPEGGNPSDVRWISIGNRCTQCGTLSSFIDWSVGYSPSAHLLDRA